MDAKNVYWAGSDRITRSGIFACAIGGCNNSPTRLRSLVPFGNLAILANQVYAIGGAGGAEWQAYSCSVNGCDDGGGLSVLWSVPNWINASPNHLVPMIGLAIDSTTAYFAKDVSPSPPGTPDTLDGGVLSCALTGCGGSPSELIPIDLVADDAGLLLPWQFAVDRTNLYWDMTRYQPNLAGPATGQVLACAKGGCGNSPTVLASGLRSPAGLTTDGISVYFTERGDTMGSNATDGRVSKCAVMQS